MVHLSSLGLSISEKEFFTSIRDVDANSSLWGLAISNVATNPEPIRLRTLIRDLKSQQKDQPQIMRSIIGEPGHTILKRL